MSNSSKIKKLTQYAVLITIEIVLQIIGNFIQLGPVSINLSLIPIVVGAILYGPICGLVLGFVNGVLVLFAPATLAVFMPVSMIGTIITCLSKCTIAGAVCGLVFKPFKEKKQLLGAVIAGILLPVINTGLFVLYSFIFFRPIINEGLGDSTNIVMFIIVGYIGWNFIFELLSSTILAPTISRLVTLGKSHSHLK